MTMQDLPGVMTGERASYPHPWTEKIFLDCLESNYYSCWVLELESQLAGHVVISAAVGEAHILNLCVYPQNQRQGWGRKLLKEAEWIARQHKAETCFLEVRPSNIVGVTLYQTMGYNEVGVRKNYYPADKGREDAIVMAKTLF
jgi:ribosomal-protein-alanine N-acetyltransferase